MTPKYHRLVITICAGCLLGLAVFLVSTALRDNIVLFFTPSELTDEYREQEKLRIGGLVQPGSIVIDGLHTSFVITDNIATVKVFYEGALPDLFREGQGVITEGAFQGQVFQAINVLAKHDETYMPREIAEALKEQGIWQGDS